MRSGSVARGRFFKKDRAVIMTTLWREEEIEAKKKNKTQNMKKKKRCIYKRSSK